jgi:hypothetical protein
MLNMGTGTWLPLTAALLLEGAAGFSPAPLTGIR